MGGAEQTNRFTRPEAGLMLTPERLAQERAAGMWPERILTDFLDAATAARPDDLAIATYRADSASETRLTYGDLMGRADRIACNLGRLGVDSGDVVAVQLPNWWEFVAIHIACLRLGAVINPLMPIFRARELEFMLGFGEAKVLIVPRLFRRFDHAALGREMVARVPTLDHLLVVDGEGAESFETELLGDPGDGAAAAATPLAPGDVMQLLYTSGTTGLPKGVMHTSNTLLSSVQPFSERLGLGADDVVFMPSPFAHQTGFCYGIMTAFANGAPLIAMDIWQPEVAAALIERYHVTYTFAATPFLSDLVAVPGIAERDLTRFRVFVTSGAPVPPSLVADARAALSTRVITGWGMTEVGIATSTLLDEDRPGPPSDGRAIPGGAVRVVDPDGVELPHGEAGTLQYRGSTLFVGYYRNPDLYGVDAEGWFDTGDVARMDADGHIRIVGRNKDIIIRGGENVPVVEVENLIYEIPQVRDVALVAMPDARLGEKGCAFITLGAGARLSFAEMIGFLEGKNLARQYLPERLEVLDEMPRTPSGKIQKFVLREKAKSFVLAKA